MIITTTVIVKVEGRDGDTTFTATTKESEGNPRFTSEAVARALTAARRLVEEKYPLP